MTTTDDDTVKGELVQSGGPLAELRAYIAGLEPEDEEVVQERILRSILTADNPDDLANAGGAVKADALCGAHLRAHALHPDESGFTDGMGWYLHVEVETVANGDRMTMSVGAQDVIVKLVQAARKNWLPFDFIMERAAKPTKKGYYPIYMRSAEAPF
jgi:hypothetical protein